MPPVIKTGVLFQLVEKLTGGILILKGLSGKGNSKYEFPTNWVNLTPEQALQAIPDLPPGKNVCLAITLVIK